MVGNGFAHPNSVAEDRELAAKTISGSFMAGSNLKKTGNPTKLVYEDVREVKQKGMSKGSRIALGIGIGAAAFIAVGVIACYALGPCRD